MSVCMSMDNDRPCLILFPNSPHADKVVFNYFNILPVPSASKKKAEIKYQVYKLTKQIFL